MVSSPPSLDGTGHPEKNQASARAEKNSLTPLELLGELESSFLASHTAILALDVEAIERCTLEQLRLIKALQATAPHNFTASKSAPEKNLTASAGRILHLARVQSSLLRRARQSLDLVVRLL